MRNTLSTKLVELGVSTIYFGAGARNSTLLKTLEDFEQKMILDERSGAFMALGRSKVTKAPVVICTTSGTAAAECLPAVIEAFYSNIKLIVLTADRPQRLRETNAPQTIDQTNIFSSFVRSKFCGELKNYSHEVISYPYHINLEIDDNDNYNQEKVTFLDQVQVSDVINSSKGTLVVLTEASQLSEKEIKHLLNKNFLFYIECTSGYSGLKHHNIINYEKTCLELIQKGQIDLVIKDGLTPFSKIWRELDRKYYKIKVLSYINEKVGVARGSIFKKIKLGGISAKDSIEIMEKNISFFCEAYPNSEITIIKDISEACCKDDIIYVGNSMSIRYLQLVFKGNNLVFASRGANGIDGQLSTAIGLASGTDAIVHCIVGDLTFLYDIGSILFNIPTNIRFHVVNNYGGRIFERVKVDPKMVIDHKISIKHQIKGFKTSEQVFEYFPDNEQTGLFWKTWLEG